MANRGIKFSNKSELNGSGSLGSLGGHLKPARHSKYEPSQKILHHSFLWNITLTLSLLLKISDGFKADTFRKIGLKGSSKDWETLVTGFIEEWEENNSGVDMFHFDSDEDVFCVYSQYIDDISLFSKLLRAACNDEKTAVSLS